MYRPTERAGLGAPPYAPPGPRGPSERVAWTPPEYAPPAPRHPVDAGPVPPRPRFDPGPPFGPGVVTPPPPAETRKGENRRWAVGATFALVVLLAGVVAYQAVRIEQLGDRLAASERTQADDRAAVAGRLDGLDGRAADLEKKAGAAFNPEAISSAALPSVFRVASGDVTGTAFAVGKQAGGKTNLITNFHVVEGVYDGGGREVFLERAGKRYPATIVSVNRGGDVAHLRTSTKINGLVTAKGGVKSGQPVVVVGAPLGLSDSVTTGVVSAVRELPDSNGPMIQFDAPINPGNSGGPVINSAKQVVGIATAKAQNAEGIGLAVPIKVACDAFKIC
ncbi:trypsin-like peptidase domain-containing protein [Asanoa sp. WMMD1127]|nr:trypsin-like peptidase domain-containing protein [Asanoa sp. WMMD1127]MDG4823806.1 trypsin-like peptidase domain-containing protein [Asanoa sp. WMMD1127]